MESYFLIYQSSTEVKRPPISYKVRSYFEKFISENILAKYRIIVGGKWKICLAIYFSVGGPTVLFKGISLAKGVRTVTNERMKIYEIVILTEPIKKSKNPYLKTIELIYEALKIFLTTTYKKIKPEFVDELWKEVDLDYLLSLPYPAPLAEQKYVGDKVKPDGSVEILEL